MRSKGWVRCLVAALSQELSFIEGSRRVSSEMLSLKSCLEEIDGAGRLEEVRTLP